MSNSFYEDTMLKEEFELVVMLQQDTEFQKWVTVSYEDRTTGEVQPVTKRPTGPRYPEKYIVEYRMPVYVSPGQLRGDWHGTATILLSESVLTSRHSRNGPHVTFHSNFEPFNNHVLRNAICTGNAWTVARDNGIWHFIILLGALINQDAFVCAEGRDFNGAAYDYWRTRDRKPVTDIKWPLNLITKGTMDFTQKGSQPSSLMVPPTSPEKQHAQTLTITKMSGKLEIKAKTASSSIVFTQKKQ
jgi:hypothetical protein